MTVQHKTGKRARQQRALERLQERIDDNRSLYVLLTNRVSETEGLMLSRTIAEMQDLNIELDNFEIEEASLLRNLGLPAVRSRYTPIPTVSHFEADCNA